MTDAAPPHLMTALNFTAADLAANRAGELSQRQRSYLRIDHQKNMILGGVLVVVFIFTVTAFLFVGIRDGNRILQVFGVILLFCNVGLSWFFAINWVRLSYDLRTNCPDVVEGAARHVVRQLGRAKTGSVRIGEAVEVPTENLEAFQAFEPGAVYRLYRTSHTHRLLSAEKINQPLINDQQQG